MCRKAREDQRRITHGRPAELPATDGRPHAAKRGGCNAPLDAERMSADVGPAEVDLCSKAGQHRNHARGGTPSHGKRRNNRGARAGHVPPIKRGSPYWRLFAAAGWKGLHFARVGGRYLHHTKVIFFPTPARSAGQRGFRRKGRPR